jgi:ABC-type lipoprotein export system ATPase subunit
MLGSEYDDLSTIQEKDLVRATALIYQSVQNVMEKKDERCSAGMRQLGKDYHIGTRTVHAVREISLQLQRGSFTAIMGPSGSGKTTLLNLIGTLDMPTHGKLFFEGIAVDSLNDDQLADFRRENIGFVFQLFNLIPP